MPAGSFHVVKAGVADPLLVVVAHSNRQFVSLIETSSSTKDLSYSDRRL